MKDRIFIDSNIWIYFYLENDEKSVLVENLLHKNRENIILSTQVINEIFNVLAHKLKVKTKNETSFIIEKIVNKFDVQLITTETIKKAMEISIKYQYRYFDSLMIASALQQKCKILYSEDLNHGQVIENMKIINPFI